MIIWCYTVRNRSGLDRFKRHSIVTTFVSQPNPVVTSPNKQVVRTYYANFGKLNRPAVLSCLTDDIEWANGFPNSGSFATREGSFQSEHQRHARPRAPPDRDQADDRGKQRNGC